MVRFAKQNCTGMKPMASEKKKSNSKGRTTSARRVQSRTSTSPKRRNALERHFVICIRNDDYPASLELRKLYIVLSDTFASDHEMLRIIDESGEDYLYPESYFVRVELSRAVERTLRKIA